MSFRLTLALILTWLGVAHSASLQWGYDPKARVATITAVNVSDSEWVDEGWYNGTQYGWLGLKGKQPSTPNYLYCGANMGDTSCYPTLTMSPCVTRTDASENVRQLVGRRMALTYDPNEYPFTYQQFTCRGLNNWSITWNGGGGMPTPASCSAASTNVVMTGLVGSPVTPWSGDLAITCSKPADIVLTLPRGGTVDLGGGQSHVAFGQGGIKVSVHASPTATVKLFASVDGVINKAGTYTGSTEVILDVQ